MYFSNSEFLRERDSSLLVDFDYDQNLFEYEQNSASPLLKGRLKTKLEYWHTIGASNFVIDTIKFGYRIPFISTPCRALFHNNKSALENASFVEQINWRPLLCGSMVLNSYQTDRSGLHGLLPRFSTCWPLKPLLMRLLQTARFQLNSKAFITWSIHRILAV